MALAIVLYIVIPVLCLWGVMKRISQDTSMNINATLAIRGIGMLFIIFTHVVKENINTTTYFFYVSGGVGVAACFLVSGYGLHTSYKRKTDYLHGFWMSRILRLLLPFFAAYGLYLILAILHGETPTFVGIANNLITITIPGVTLWYLKIQMLMYAAFYFAYRFFPDMRTKIIGTLVITVAYIVTAAVAGMELFWYNTCLFFPLGLFLAEYEHHILQLIKKNVAVLLFGGIFACLYVVLFFFGRLNVDWLFDTVYMICFCAIVLWLVQRYTRFRVLEILGKFSIEIYLIHTVIGGYFDSASPLTYLLLPLVSVLAGVPIHWFSNKITTLFIHKGK